MTLLTFSNLSGNRRYEVLDARDAYGTGAPFLVRFSIAGVPISDHPYTTAIKARDNFERMVVEASEEVE